jgi:hypothetical protein
LCVFHLAALAAALVFGHDSHSWIYRYDDLCDPPEGGECNFTMTINLRDADWPYKGEELLAYYQITGFYQNHFRIKKSFSLAQMIGDDAGDPAPESCWPASDNGIRDIRVPCGLLPNAFPQVRFELGPYLSRQGIAGYREQSRFFKQLNPVYSHEAAVNGSHGNWLDDNNWVNNTNNEDFIVWMRPAVHSTFRKLYARANDEPIAPFDIVIHNHWNDWSDVPNTTEKALVFATQGLLGGENKFFAGASGVAAALALMSYFIFRACANDLIHDVDKKPGEAQPPPATTEGLR